MDLQYQGSLFDTLDLLDGGPGLQPLGDAVERISLSQGAWLDLRPGWLDDSDAVFEQLALHVPWVADRREMYDRVVDVPRLVSRYGRGDELPLPILTEAREALNDHYGRPPRQVFETAGLCFYRTGDDSVAWHGDRVGRTLHQDTMVAILSVGAERTLSVRPKGGGAVMRFPVGHGDLIVMGGSCQRTHEHAILKTKRAVGPRISVQFRPYWPR
ncbi:alpha-ketoglutarate-dependent dioxygenase AlkB [Cnuibacter physcomitrellae]|uniref:alpha-ketoglutarate-dependent dioxygenase AlkB n=1 Tax=Cnuibacter physcomitrellae TaxID=1619308 RepID=UPI002175D83E|nr:alpha-ketoglutarate-dependent dioxygenase AlkB [Cnuibacter physcomitrellae]MCS5497235.1 alpha-ketoglutarate-dependent dioxygenase AlkB [Cnuibacter physcomitrellae]